MSFCPAGFSLIARQIFLTFALLSWSGCGILFGNIKPTDQKSETYEVSQLDKEFSQNWKKLETSSNTAESESGGSETPDTVFQSKKNSSIISLNSVCRPGSENRDQTLHEYSRQLFLGMTDVELNEEKKLTIQEVPALETTQKGKMGNEPIMLRSLVLKKRSCIYDLLYVSRPEHFSVHEPDFTQFYSSLRIK